ncbi:MAG: DNA mismatch repair endonuclease MutL [Butyrivibrio sp.]|jgi:DNA mismatch repair protein MutL|nr:DNA mismatch repair endonuclease MutL [Butyrivibrio sp.]
MAEIHELDKNTIDQIAAGEVVERPASVVKELVENAIDSGADAVTVEIRGGGIDMIRVTDNGTGIEKSQIRKAFKRHATSKIERIEDLFTIHSLGFRGEALSSISAVAQVDLITKTAQDLTGIRYTINGGEEAGFEEIGAPQGTTIIMRNLFFNTPARKKFLKQPQTEGSYIGDLMEHMALDNPSVSFHFINNKDDRFHTTGNGDLKELIYRIYGRDIACSLVPIRAEENGLVMEGYLGEPVINRSNRNFETFFVNGRYIKDKVISRALEEGYRQYLMQHKFPFVVLHIRMDPDMVDINVHPSKMEVHFTHQQLLYDFIVSHVFQVLHDHEMIPDALMDEAADRKESAAQKAAAAPKASETMVSKAKASEAKPSEAKPSEAKTVTEIRDVDTRRIAGTFSSEAAAVISEKETETVPEPFETKRMKEQKLREEVPVYAEGITEKPVIISDQAAGKTASPVWSRVIGDTSGTQANTAAGLQHSPIIKADEQIIVEKNVQLDMFEEKMLTREHREEYEILGQIFDTYWILAFKDKIFLVDQHAAHEKVNYERMLRRFHENDIASQMINPPVILTLSAQEEDLFIAYRSYFEKLGFQIDDFGGHEYAMREIPIDLYGCENAKEMFMEIMDELSHETGSKDPEVITAKLASMACKASVKGNTHMTREEMSALIDELLTLDNPYNCPHGRPTIVSMSKYEIDKKFKRIV